MQPFDVADGLRACLVTLFEGDPNPPAEICHRPGNEAPLSAGTAQDECCSGLAWVRISGIEPVLNPDDVQNPDFNPCDHPERRVTIELGVARCNPFGTQERGPTCAEWTELAMRMDLDAYRMRQAVCCMASQSYVGPYAQVTRILPGAWEPIESSGHCAGGIMQVYAWLSCEECES